MAFYVILVVKDDPDSVFDWVTENIPPKDVIRQIARRVNYEFLTSRSRNPGDPLSDELGWFMKFVVGSRTSVDRIVEFWQSKVGRCEVIDFDRAHLTAEWGRNEDRLNRLYAASGLDRELSGAEIERLEGEQDRFEYLLGLDDLPDSRRWSGAR